MANESGERPPQQPDQPEDQTPPQETGGESQGESRQTTPAEGWRAKRKEQQDRKEQEERRRQGDEIEEPPEPGHRGFSRQEIIDKVMKPFGEVNEEIMKNLFSNTIKVNDDPAKLTEDERDKLNEFLVGDKTIANAEVASALGKLGISPEQAQVYSELYPQAQEMIKAEARELGLRIGQNNKNLGDKFADAVKKLDKDEVIKNFFKPGPDGNIIPEEKRREFRKLIEGYYYELFGTFDENVSRPFGELYDSYTHGFYVNGLNGLVEALVRDPEIRDQLKRGSHGEYEFLQYMSVYAHGIRNYAQLFHDMPIYALDAGSQEKFRDFIGFLYPSELPALLDDPIIQVARREVPRYIRRRIALNGNSIPQDLFDARYSETDVIWRFKDQEALREIIKKRVDKLYPDMQVEDWEIRRALTYSVGIGLMTLEDVEVMGTANSPSDFKGIPAFVEKLKARFKWKFGRGGTAIMHVKELMTMPVEYNPEKKSFAQRLFGRGYRTIKGKYKHDPEALHHYAETKIGEHGEVLDYHLLDRQGAWTELMSILDIGSFPTRWGWRADHLMPDANSQTGRRLAKLLEDVVYTDKKGNRVEKLNWEDKDKKWGQIEWNEFYKVATKEFGSGILWAYLGKRVDAEMVRHLSEQLGYLDADGNGHLAHGSEIEKYSLGEKAFDKIFTITRADGSEEKVTFYDFRQSKEWQIKGEIFMFMLQRSPGDFLMNLTQLVPELLKPGDDLWQTEDVIRTKYGKDKTKIGQVLTVKHSVLEAWGEENFRHLEKIRNFFSDVYTQFENDPRFADYEVEADKKQAIMEYFFDEAGTALELVIREGRLNNLESDFDDQRMRDLVLGVNGIVPYLTQTDENFGEYDRIGNYGFFYTMGRAWSIKNGATNPNMTDVDTFKIYQDIAQIGQAALKRHQNDVTTWAETIADVAELDEILTHAAADKSENRFEKLHEVMQKVHTLERIVGFGPANQANYIIASLAAKYFWEHDLARLPGGVLANWPFKFILGRKVSLSKMHEGGGLYAYSMDEDKMRKFWRELAFEKHILPEKGRWSAQHGQLEHDASADTEIVGNVIPTIMTALIAYAFFIWIKNALEEEVEGKKK